MMRGSPGVRRKFPLSPESRKKFSPAVSKSHTIRLTSLPQNHKKAQMKTPPRLGSYTNNRKKVEPTVIKHFEPKPNRKTSDDIPEVQISGYGDDFTNEGSKCLQFHPVFKLVDSLLSSTSSLNKPNKRRNPIPKSKTNVKLLSSPKRAPKAVPKPALKSVTKLSSLPSTHPKPLKGITDSALNNRQKIIPTYNAVNANNKLSVQEKVETNLNNISNKNNIRVSLKDECMAKRVDALKMPAPPEPTTYVEQLKNEVTTLVQRPEMNRNCQCVTRLKEEIAMNRTNNVEDSRNIVNELKTEIVQYRLNKKESYSCTELYKNKREWSPPPVYFPTFSNRSKREDVNAVQFEEYLQRTPIMKDCPHKAEVIERFLGVAQKVDGTMANPIQTLWKSKGSLASSSEADMAQIDLNFEDKLEEAHNLIEKVREALKDIGKGMQQKPLDEKIKDEIKPEETHNVDIESIPLPAIPDTPKKLNKKLQDSKLPPTPEVSEETVSTPYSESMAILKKKLKIISDASTESESTPTSQQTPKQNLSKAANQVTVVDRSCSPWNRTPPSKSPRFQSKACSPRPIESPCTPKSVHSHCIQNVSISNSPKCPCSPKTNPCSPKSSHSPCTPRSIYSPCVPKDICSPRPNKSDYNRSSPISKHSVCVNTSHQDPCSSSSTKERVTFCDFTQQIPSGMGTPVSVPMICESVCSQQKSCIIMSETNTPETILIHKSLKTPLTSTEPSSEVVTTVASDKSKKSLKLSKSICACGSSGIQGREISFSADRCICKKVTEVQQREVSTDNKEVGLSTDRPKAKLSIQVMPAINIRSGLVMQRTLNLSIKPTGSGTNQVTEQSPNVYYKEIKTISEEDIASRESIVKSSHGELSKKRQQAPGTRSESFTSIPYSEAPSSWRRWSLNYDVNNSMTSDQFMVLKSFQVMNEPKRAYTDSPLDVVSVRNYEQMPVRNYEQMSAHNHEQIPQNLVIDNYQPQNQERRSPWDFGFYASKATQCTNENFNSYSNIYPVKYARTPDRLDDRSALQSFDESSSATSSEYSEDIPVKDTSSPSPNEKIESEEKVSIIKVPSTEIGIEQEESQEESSSSVSSESSGSVRQVEQKPISVSEEINTDDAKPKRSSSIKKPKSVPSLIPEESTSEVPNGSLVTEEKLDEGSSIHSSFESVFFLHKNDKDDDSEKFSLSENKSKASRSKERSRSKTIEKDQPKAPSATDQDVDKSQKESVTSPEKKEEDREKLVEPSVNQIVNELIQEIEKGKELEPPNRFQDVTPTEEGERLQLPDNIEALRNIKINKEDLIRESLVPESLHEGEINTAVENLKQVEVNKESVESSSRDNMSTQNLAKITSSGEPTELSIMSRGKKPIKVEKLTSTPASVQKIDTKTQDANLQVAFSSSSESESSNDSDESKKSKGSSNNSLSFKRERRNSNTNTITNFITGLTGKSEHSYHKFRKSNDFLRSTEFLHNSLSKLIHHNDKDEESGEVEIANHPGSDESDLSESTKIERLRLFQKLAQNPTDQPIIKENDEAIGDKKDQKIVMTVNAENKKLESGENYTPCYKKSLPFYRQMIDRMISSPLHKRLNSSLSDPTPPADDSISEGELNCKCTISIGEVHTCKFGSKEGKRIKYLKKHPENTIRKELGDKTLKIARQRTQYNNWVTYYLQKNKDFYVNDSSYSTSSNSSHSK